MPVASLRCRSARFDDEMLNQMDKIATFKNYSVGKGIFMGDQNQGR